MTQHAISIDPSEIAKFEAMAEEWWSETGKFRPLHQFNPVRIGYIKSVLAELMPLSPESNGSAPKTSPTILDIGCGGGLLAEPLARLGYHVTGIDASEKNIAIASLHAEKTGVKVNYHATSAEAFAETGVQYDLVMAMEVVEHVANVSSFLEAAAKMVKPNGKLLVATLNRTAKSYAFAIIGAEYILRWLPKGTHDWKKFLKPSEIASIIEPTGCTVQTIKGAVFNPIKSTWSLSDNDIAVNYMMLMQKH